MFGIANKNYVKDLTPNSYLGQQSLSKRTSRYVTGPCLIFVRGGGGGGHICFHILGDICCVGEA